MKTEIPGVDWLLLGEPRPAQIEAIARSYTGKCWRNSKFDDLPSLPIRDLRWSGNPVDGFPFFMEMRVGKTPTLLNEFMLFKRDYGIKKCVVFSPSSYKYTWAIEAEAFGIDVPVHVYESANKKAAEKFVKENPEFMIIFNYEVTVYDKHLDFVKSIVDDRTYLGADESVAIKNRDSLFSQGLLDLGPRAAVCRPLTGKPNPQGPHDLYTQLRFARKLEGVNFYAFRGRYSKLGGFKNKKVIGTRNEEELYNLLNNVSFIARRRDWGTKIDSDYEKISLNMHERQLKAYKEMEEDFITFLDDGSEIAVDMAMAKHMKLQQISSGFVIDEYGEAHEIVPFDKTSKFVDLRSKLYDQITGKTIVVAYYGETIKRLKENLKSLNPAVIAGKPRMKEWGLSVDEEKAKFNNDPSCRVIIGQVRSLKYGHTLMGNNSDPCLDLYFFENTYSLDDRSQVEERPQGEGQLDAIHIADYFSSPIEKKIVTALQDKEAVSSIVLDYYRQRKLHGV